MNRILGWGLAAVALVAIVLLLTQSQSLTQTQATLAAARSTSTAQSDAMAEQLTAISGTVEAAATQAADDRAQALGNAQSEAATAQSGAVSAAQDSAATSQAQAVGEVAATSTANGARLATQATAQVATMQAHLTQAAADLNDSAATAQAQALSSANDAATAQAQALSDANDTNATEQAQALATAAQAAATAQAQAVSDVQVDIDATLTAAGDAISAAATAQAGALADAQNARATDAAVFVATQAVLNEQLATLQAQLAAVQSIVTTPVSTPDNLTPSGPASTPSLPPDVDVTPLGPTTDATLIPGWQRVVGRGVAIQLPESFENSNQNVDSASMARLLRSLGPEFELSAAMIEQNPDLFRLVTVDQRSKTGVISNLIIIRQAMPLAMPLDTVLADTLQQYPSGLKVLDTSTIQAGEYEVGRIVVENNLTPVTSKQIQYFIVIDSIAWIVTFTTGADEFEARQPTFDQSIQTIEFLPEE